MKIDIDDAMRVHLELLEEISLLQNQVMKLRDRGKIVREVVDRFVHPDLRDSAEKWLSDRGL